MRDVVYSVGYGIASRAVLLIINVMAVRLLVTNEYGFFSYFLSVVASIATFSAFGTSVTANTYVSKYSDSDPDFAKRIVFYSIIFVTVLTIVSSILLLPFFKLPDQTIIGIDWLFPLLIVALVWLFGMNSVAEGTLNGLGAYKQLSANALIICVVAIPVAFLLMWWLGFLGGLLAVMFYRALMVVFNGAALVRLGYLLRYPLSTVCDRVIIKSFSDVSVPSVLGGLMVAPVIAVSMRMISNLPEGLKELAYFSWVYQIYIVAVFVPSVLGGYFLSRFSREASGTKKLGNILRFNVIFSVIVMACLFVSKDLLLRIAGDEYLTKSDLVFNLMMPAVVLYGLNATFASYWPAVGRNWVGFMMNLLWAVVLVTTVWFFREQIGAAALALGFLVAYGAQFFVQAALIGKFYLSNEYAK